MINYKFAIFLLLFFCVSASFSTGEKEFFQAHQWTQEKAEILEYSVKKIYLSKEMLFSAFFITEGFYYSVEGKSIKKPQKNYLPILNSSLTYSFKRADYSRHTISTIKVYRQPDMPLIREKSQIISWDGQITRQMTQESGKTIFEVESWLEGNSRLIFKEIPVWSAEQLFLRLRNISFDSFSTKQIGLMNSFLDDHTDSKVYFAEIKLHENIIVLQDQKTRHITITLENNKVFEFWLRADGLHTVVLAKFPDGTTFTLKSMKWEERSMK